MTTIINVEVEKITPSKIDGGTVGSYGFHKLSFRFSSEWKGLGKRIVFDIPRSAPVALAITDDTAEYDIPAEVKAHAGEIPFTIEGYFEDNAIYTVSGVVVVESSSAKPTRYPPTPSEVQQIYTYLSQAQRLYEYAFNPKGKYSDEEAYNYLDVIEYNNDIYIAKKFVKGVEPTDGEYYMLAMKHGESAYEIAIRLGTFEGTEEEWNNYIAVERDKAIDAIVKTAAETLASIPEDYTALSKDISDLNNVLYYTDRMKWYQGNVDATTGVINKSYKTRIRALMCGIEDNIYSIKAANGYKFLVYAFENQTYLGSLRGGEFKAEKGADWQIEFNCLDFPKTYKYVFVGAKSDDTENIDPTEGVNFLFYRSNIANDLVGESDIPNIAELSKGEMYIIPTSGTEPMPLYMVNENGGIYESDEIYSGTDYMPCPKNLIIDFARDKKARLVIHFYDLIDGEYVPRWDILNIKTTTNYCNQLNLTSSCNAVLEIPDGVYMRVCKPIDGDVNLYGWSGAHIGCEMSGTHIVPFGTNNAEMSMESGHTALTIPGAARLLWLKGFAINLLIGLKEDGSKDTIINSGVSYTVRLPRGYKSFRVRLFKRENATPEKPEGNAVSATYPVNFNEFASCLCDFTENKPYGRAKQILDTAKYISNIEWVCKKDKEIANTSAGSKFKTGTKYKGIPYASSWMKPCYFGWHITKHTFLNAANDEDSIFYAESGRKGGPGYSQVCSIFAGLCAGYPYPVVTYGFLRDPNMVYTITNTPEIGGIMYNDNGHCLIPETHGNGVDFSEYTIYEGVSPVSLRRSNFDVYKGDSTEVNGYKYINEYIYAVHHKAETGEPNAYNIYDGTITNGSARPYRGDRSVYTSDDDILINIKDENATKCYVQKCTYSPVTGVFTPTSDAAVTVSFSAGTKQISLNKSMLSDSCFYGVYTDTDSTMEYFEYHVSPTANYSMSADNFTFETDGVNPWYSVWWQDDVPSGKTELIPYKMDGDYTGYRKVYNPNKASGVMFFKGTLGAYKSTLSFKS